MRKILVFLAGLAICAAPVPGLTWAQKVAVTTDSDTGKPVEKTAPKLLDTRLRYGRRRCPARSALAT